MVKLIVLHFIADFLLQTRDMGRLKSSRWDYLLAHLAIQFAVFALFCGPWFALWNALVHGVIDKSIWNLYKLAVVKRYGITEETAKDFKFWEDKMFFDFIGFDQMLHMITLAVLAGIYNI